MQPTQPLDVPVSDHTTTGQLDLERVAFGIRDDLDTFSKPETWEPGRSHARAVMALRGNTDALVAEVRRLRALRGEQ